MDTEKGEIRPLAVVIVAVALLAILFVLFGLNPRSTVSPDEVEDDGQVSEEQVAPTPAPTSTPTPEPLEVDSDPEVPDDRVVPDPTGNFEFLDVDNNYSPVSTFPLGRRTHIVVNSPGAQDARPITVVARVNGEQVWEGKIEAGQPNCADDNRCSLDGPDPSITSAWEGEVEIEARDELGNLFLLFWFLAQG